MTSAPVLHLPNFSKPFIIETDASATGIGAVLLQDDHPIAFFSKKLGPRRLSASTYHRELYAIVEAIQKWRQYLLGRTFTIRTDQRSLRELLHQIIQTPEQHFFIRKLMGYQFTIEYKQGSSNRVADALSRRNEVDEPALLLETYCQPPPELISTLRRENKTLPELLQHHELAAQGNLQPPFSIHDGLVFYNHRLCLSASSSLIKSIIEECHATPSAGHPGVDHTFRRVATSFYWPRMRADIRRFVMACITCQTTKYSTKPPAGLLQPLPIPTQVWDEVTMDFITGLPPSRGLGTIMVVVDRLTKFAHFGALPASFDAHRVAALFVDVVIKLHGFPVSIVSDRDPIFLSNFWTELFRLSGTSLKRSTAYHPQTDGQSEVKNRGLEQYLRAFAHARPTRWTILLPWAEFVLNTTFHDGLKMSPFQALYGRLPPSIIPYKPRSSTLPAVDDVLSERDELMRQLRRNLGIAQQRMRESANRHRRELTFQIGDLVLLKLQPYRQCSVARKLSAKISKRFYGPFKVIERVGEVAYRLELPESASIHPVFHVSLLRPYIASSTQPVVQSLPADFIGDRPLSIPIAAVRERTILKNGKHERQWLIQWSGGSLDDASWEPVQQLLIQFPDLHLEDKVVLQPEGDVTESPLIQAQDLSAEETEQAAAIRNPIGGPIAEAHRREARAGKQPTYLKDYVLSLETATHD